MEILRKSAERIWRQIQREPIISQTTLDVAHRLAKHGPVILGPRLRAIRKQEEESGPSFELEVKKLKLAIDAQTLVRPLEEALAKIDDQITEEKAIRHSRE